MKKSLLAVQGPLQFVAGFLAMQWFEQIKNDPEECTSVLLLYDFLAPESIELELVEVINRLASVHEWHSVIFIGGKSMEVIMNGTYSNSIRKLRDTIGESVFDEIYLARDYCGHGSSLIMNAYKSASRIIYGDSLGIVGNEAGINVFNWQAPMRSILSVAKRFLRRCLYGGPDRLRFEVAVLTLPITCSADYLDDITLWIPAKEFVVATVKSIYDNLNELSQYCDHLIAAAGDTDRRLFLLSNLHGSGLMSKENEIDLYLDVIKEMAEKGSTILLKAHPRNSNEVLQTLADRLQSSYKIVAIDDGELSRIPIELWVRLIKGCEIIPMFSTSAINLRYIYDITVRLPLNERLVRKYFYKSKVAYMLEGNHLISKSIENLDHWDGKSLLFDAG
jgi:hypothetical protein